MGGQVFNLLVIIAFGVMLADAIANPAGTKNIITGVTGIWSTSVNGMLGKAS